MKWAKYLESAYPKSLREEYSKKNIIHRIHRWIGLYLGYFFYHIGFTANMVDILRTIISLLALYFISFLGKGDWLPLIGSFLLYGQNLLDAADGSVARVRNEMSHLGSELDMFTNYFSRGAILVLFAFLTGNPFLLILSALSIFALITFREDRIGSDLPKTPALNIVPMSYRFFMLVQTLLFIIPFIISLINIYNMPLAIESCAFITYLYGLLAALWFGLCLKYKKE